MPSSEKQERIQGQGGATPGPSFEDVLREEIRRRGLRIVRLRAQIKTDAADNAGYAVACRSGTISLLASVERLRDTEREHELLSDTLAQYGSTKTVQP